MARTQGTTIVWGISTTGISGFALVGSSTNAFTGSDFSIESDKTDVKNGAGNVIAEYYYNYRTTLGLKCYPAGSGADVTALPVPGEKVTVADSADSQLAGDWICQSVSKAKTNEGHCEFDIQLAKPDLVTPS